MVLKIMLKILFKTKGIFVEKELVTVGMTFFSYNRRREGHPDGWNLL